MNTESVKNGVCFFLPVRGGSKRILSKNTRPFADVPDGLLGIKIRQLLKSTRIEEVVLSTNDENAVSIAAGIDTSSSDVKLRIVRRPEHLCLDTTNLQDVIEYVPSVTSAPHILWGHVTTPFADEEVYDKAIDTYIGGIGKGFDSLLSVLSFQNFLIDPSSGKLLNQVEKPAAEAELRWPRTQDLKLLYEVNHAVFLASRTIYETTHDRIGSNPSYFEMNGVQSFDIDWQDDFTMAEALYRNLQAK